jgi:hypothetical protein
MKTVAAGLIAIALLLGPAAQAQTQAHIDDVKKAQKSAYAIGDSTYDCPAGDADLHGWPAHLLRYCEYKQGGLTGVVYLLTIAPERTALWIETSCAKRMPGESGCFRVVLQCGRLNSGMMFPVSGNVIEDNQNIFFRNGMTVYMPGFKNWSTDKIDRDVQLAAAKKANSAITKIPSGLTRFWRTLPRHLATLYPDSGAPEAVTEKEGRQAWLEVARKEILSALDKPENRLLDAYMAAHPNTLRAALGKPVIKYADCPGEASP